MEHVCRTIRSRTLLKRRSIGAWFPNSLVTWQGNVKARTRTRTRPELSEGRSSPSNLGSLIRLYTNSIGNINISLRSQCHFLYFRYILVGLQASLVVPLSSATSTGWNKLYTQGGGGGALNNRFRADRGSLDPFVLSFFSIPSLNFCDQGKNLFTFPISKFDTFI